MSRLEQPAPITRTGTTAEQLMARACEQTGLDDFGSDSFREGLEVLVDSVEHEPVLKPGIKELHYEWCVKGLVNRLRVADYAKAHPEVRQERIERPLIVMGMPRSGTTVASNLLAQDPGRRSLLLWESWQSVPPPTTATLRTDPRALAWLEEQHRELAAETHVRPHFEWADGPTEDIRLHQQDFKALAWEMWLPVPEYSRWIMQADATSAYEYQKLVLQILQSRAPGTWSLKMPSHALQIEWLVEVFPDARLVWTHRDPYRAFASLASMKTRRWERGTGYASLDWFREHYPWQLAEQLNRPTRVRQRIGRDRIYDLHYADMMRDPIGELRRLYAWAGDEFTPEVESRMAAWLAENPQGRFGKHEYDLDQFGVTKHELEPWFADYLATHDVEPEGT